MTLAETVAVASETAHVAPVTKSKSRRSRFWLVVCSLVIVLFVGVFVSAASGQLAISPGEMIGALLGPIGFAGSGESVSPLVESTLWQIRFPRIMMSLLVGGALAVAGVVMQSIFGNPLAEPGVVGVSSGAAVGAAVAITLGLTSAGSWVTAVLAFAGGFGATLLVYGAARVRGRTDSVRLILTGIAVNAFAGALLAVLMFTGSAASREQIVFWQLGSMNGSRWGEVAIVAVITAISLAIAVSIAPRYDLLALGDRTAAHLGVRVERLRILSIVLVALLTGVAVAFVGIIAFVGLVIPHLFRGIIGPSNRSLMVASFLGGGALLVYADLFARTVVPAADLPIGILTSLLGGPFFYWLIRRNAGGWS